MYIRPEDVLSPRDKVKNLEILIKNDKEDYSIALLEYDGTECVGVRWNTTNEEKGLWKFTYNPAPLAWEYENKGDEGKGAEYKTKAYDAGIPHYKYY